MRNLTLGDLKLALRHLLNDKEKLEELRRSATGKLYEPRLRAKQKALEAIPDPALKQAPLAAELAETDGVHDGFGAATYYICLAIEAHPRLPVPLKEAAKRVLETFVPQLGVLRAPYADEAAAALDNRPELTQLKTELKAIAVPGGGTLYDWVKNFLAAGDKIDKLLRDRAAKLATSENAGVTAPLRSSTVGVMGRFREALRDELEDDGCTLGADYEAKLFAYIDKLSTDRAAASTTSTEDVPPPIPEKTVPGPGEESR
jgi:hypothetical protein